MGVRQYARYVNVNTVSGNASGSASGSECIILYYDSIVHYIILYYSISCITYVYIYIYVYMHLGADRVTSPSARLGEGGLGARPHV